jgi:two-component system response regulator RegA
MPGTKRDRSEALALDPAAGPLLLVDQETGSRTMLERGLAKYGFEVVTVAGGQAALAAVAERPFAFAVVEMRLGDGSGLALVEQLRQHNESMRIVVVTGFDSFASVVIALRSGAIDYLPKPTDPAAVAGALLGLGTILAPVPESPLGIERICWEHIQRVFEQCGRNVTRTAQQLRMHRRTLQRILGKRAPLSRAHAPGATEAPVSRFRRQHAGSRRSQF